MDTTSEHETAGPWHQENFQAFCDAMKNEWCYARESSFEPFHSLHEGYAVLLEETQEIEALTFMPRHLKAQAHPHMLRQALIKECIQVATMAFCIMDECLGDVHQSEIDNYRVE